MLVGDLWERQGSGPRSIPIKGTSVMRTNMFSVKIRSDGENWVGLIPRLGDLWVEASSLLGVEQTAREVIATELKLDPLTVSVEMRSFT
jgi:hypothetical protein